MLKTLTKSQPDISWSNNAEILSVYADMNSESWHLGLINTLDNSNFQNAISALAKNAVVPNPFFDLPILQAAEKNLDSKKVCYLYLSKKSGNEDNLKFFAAVQLSSIGIFRHKVLRTWNHPYAPLGMPLVAKNDSNETLKALIECIQVANHPSASAIVFEHIAREGSFINDLYRSCHLSDRLLFAGGITRAALKPIKNLDYIGTHFSGKRKQRLRKAKTELEKFGAVTFSSASDSKSIKIPLEEFLALEQSGWKGKKKTALKDSLATETFCREAVSSMTAQNRCHIHSLKSDDKTIASLVTFESQGYYYPWKIAFDEKYAKYSVGNLLSTHATAEFANNTNFKGLDSLAAEYNQTTLRYWPDQKEFFTMIIGIGKTANQTTLKITNEINRIKRIKTTIRNLLK